MYNEKQADIKKKVVKTAIAPNLSIMKDPKNPKTIPEVKSIKF